MARRPIRDVLLRTTSSGEFQLVEVAGELPIARLPNRLAVDRYLALHALRVVATPASSPQGAAQGRPTPAAPGAADQDQVAQGGAGLAQSKGDGT